MSELEGLKKQRSILRGILTKLSKFAKGIDDSSQETIEEMRIKANRAKKLLDKIAEIEASLLAIDTTVESKMDEAEETYYDIVSRLNTWIKKRGVCETSITNNDTSLNLTTMSTGPEVRLAKLQIPTFSGDYTEWQEALRKLKQRYDRKRHTINAFIRNFIEQPNVQIATANNIRKLLDTSDEVIRGLKALGDQAEARDPWLIYLLLQKLYDETRSLWAQQNTNNEFPSIIDFIDFLIKRTDALESVKTHSSRSVKSNIQNKPKSSFAITTTSNCIACETQHHRLIQCTRFKSLSVDERRSLISNHKRCFNCFNPGHKALQCRIRGRCRRCSYKHHSLLHVDQPTTTLNANIDASGNISEDSVTQTHHARNDLQSKIQDNAALMCTQQTVLPTALINILDNMGIPRTCRALLDTASQAFFITELMVQKLGLPRSNCRNLLMGIGGISGGTSRGIITLRLMSRFNTIEVASINALIIPKISSSLPAIEFDIKHLGNLTEIELADPSFNKSGPIDVLLGAEIVFDLFEDGNRKLGSSNLRAHKTKFGWIIGGTNETDIKPVTQSFATTIDIDAALQRFWKIEEVTNYNTLSKEEQYCEEWFNMTTRRASDGHFITKLPFKEQSKPLGSTYQQAMSRFIATERRFKTDDQFRQLYQSFLNEYETLHHMKKADITNEELHELIFCRTMECLKVAAAQRNYAWHSMRQV